MRLKALIEVSKVDQTHASPANTGWHTAATPSTGPAIGTGSGQLDG
jgi:hypothetical protein